MTGRVHAQYVQQIYAVCTAFISTLFVVLLIVGLLAPRMSAAVAEIVPGMQTMVICTGQGLVTLTIGADGIPVETPQIEQHDCVLADITVVAEMAPQFWEKLAWDHRLRFAVTESEWMPGNPLRRRSPTRGPPVLI